MKKIIVTLLSAALALSLYAHPATDIKAKFSAPAKNLVLTYLHPVKDEKSHYISEVKIELNGKTVITQTLSLQDNQASGNLTYKIPEAKEGDKITIKTKCNKIGSKEMTITVAGLKEPVNKEVPEAVPEKEAEPAKQAVPLKDAKISPKVPVNSK
ncbi:MAG: hypothetical protein PHF33_03760 [Candidatus Delongbacteria bacterium]|nr:hypothetical protein [Candidatus Delongbacteria bacterium]MDD4205434.1 hypothetical protein [Candidatus Delongbacteria bacterium]